MTSSSDDLFMKVGKMTCVAETMKAILVEGPLRDGKVGQLWTPKSVLGKGNRCKKVGDVGMLVVKQWWGEREL
jgi:hypothetical protein